MLLFSTLSFLIVFCLLLINSSNLLFLLLLLEVMGFIIMFTFTFICGISLASDFFLLILFSVFVMEGVLGLFGLILLVSFTGSDYLSSSSLTRC